MKTKDEKRRALAELDLFMGSSTYCRYSPQLFPEVVLTEGVRFLAETAECFWLIDEIASFQQHSAIRDHPALQDIQFWTLRVHQDKSASLICEWDLGEVVYEKRIERTSFPLSEQKIWVSRSDEVIVLLLPNEY